jgi:hypothetical protein
MQDVHYPGPSVLNGEENQVGGEDSFSDAASFVEQRTTLGEFAQREGKSR